MRTPIETVLACAAVAALCCNGSGGGGGGGGYTTPSGEHPHVYLNDTVKARLSAALAAGDPAAVRFRDMVDGQLAGADEYGFEGWFAALLYQLTGEEAYGRYAVQDVERFVKAEEQRIAAGQAAQVAFGSYLYVGDSVGNLALVYDWCWDLLTPDQRQRWASYAQQAVWNVWHPDDAAWGGHPHPWSGWSIENPSNNYYYSFLRATMLFGLAAAGEHPDAAGWVDFFRQEKIGDELVPMFARDLVGGGSREGNGYGVSQARLFELYELWQQSTGERIADLTPHARASMARYLYLTVPTFEWVAPVGDFARESTGAWFDYDRNYVQTLAWLYRDDPLAARARWLLRHGAVQEMGHSFMYVNDFLFGDPAASAAPLDDLGLAYHAPGIGQLYTRSSWATDATWLSLSAGPYTESHAHHDQGSFLLYRNGWLADDENRRTHSGIRQEEELHNLVRIEDSGGATVPQQWDESSRLVALADQPGYTYAAADVTPMYQGGSPAVGRAERELVFARPSVVIVFDRVESAPETRHVWQLNSPGRPTVSGSSATFGAGAGALHVQRLLPAGASWSVLDWQATDEDVVDGGFRLDDVSQPATGRSRFLHVLWIGDAVTSVEPADDGTRRGALVYLAGGGSVRVRFEESAWGGDIQLTGGSGTSVDGALPSGVATLPLFP